MSLNLTAEEKAAGQANFNSVAETLKTNPDPKWTRRDFIKSAMMAGGVIVPVTAASYFLYDSAANGLTKPVKAALIGAGDEGGVLVGEHNPKFLQIVAVCD